MGVNVNWPNPVTELIEAYLFGETDARKKVSRRDILSRIDIKAFSETFRCPNP
jgi:hypothetical protein